MPEEKKLTEDGLKERIKSYAAQLDTIRTEITALRAQLAAKEDAGKQIVGGIKTLQELAKEVQ